MMRTSAAKSAHSKTNQGHLLQHKRPQLGQYVSFLHQQMTKPTDIALRHDTVSKNQVIQETMLSRQLF